MPNEVSQTERKETGERITNPIPDMDYANYLPALIAHNEANSMKGRTTKHLLLQNFSVGEDPLIKILQTH